MNNSITPQELTALHERGVHFVLCLAKDQGARKSKSAIQKGWQNKPPALKHVQAHVQGGRATRFRPWQERSVGARYRHLPQRGQRH